jgi:hypothetical protein
VESRQTEAPVRLGHSRFGNFSDAADFALGALSGSIRGLMVLGRLEGRPVAEGYRRRATSHTLRSVGINCLASAPAELGGLRQRTR